MSDALDLSFERIRSSVMQQNYCFFEKGDFNLNLIGVRTKDTTSNQFNDYFLALFFVNKQPQCISFPATTDPGVYWRKNPMNVNGTAIVKPGQYRSLWKIGKHQCCYLALVQTSPITVYRDNNGDDKLDQGNEQTGVFGINCHRASAVRTSQVVDRWSAGCQVLANPRDFDLLMSLCLRGSRSENERFTYTLLTEEQLIEL